MEFNIKNIRKHFIVLVALLMCGCTQYVIKHGEGVLTSSNGDMFEGVLKDGKPLSGSLHDKQGFEKEVLNYDTNAFKQGEGTFTFENGDTFEGELKDGKPWNGVLYDKRVLRKIYFQKVYRKATAIT